MGTIRTVFELRIEELKLLAVIRKLEDEAAPLNQRLTVSYKALAIIREKLGKL